MALQVVDRGFYIEKSVPIRHAFFGKPGGVSTGIYNSLNCAPGSNDSPTNVMKNREIAAEVMRVTPHSLLTLNQVHSNLCVKINMPWKDNHRPNADALVTDVSNLALGVLTADCVPVLFYGIKNNGAPVIGAAHAGWQGALNGIIGSTVNTLLDYDVSIESISAAIGPAIGQSSYEVKDEFVQKFLNVDKKNMKYFQPSKRQGHFMFDLQSYVRSCLKACGISNITNKDIDTYFNEEDFFSYRRSVHRHEPDYGRQLSAIVID